ncbi:hypothetical protein CSQ96_06295 [Janthinobacterium sp. BJB412]|nr:hypothetical protein CSQ96_06295 [Janthinobacterium sp. BJB412]
MTPSQSNTILPPAGAHATMSPQDAPRDTTPPAIFGPPQMNGHEDVGWSGPLYSTTTTPVFTGKTEANALVYLYDVSSYDGLSRKIGGTQADTDGYWSIRDLPLKQGQHTVYFAAVDAAGNRADSPETVFIVDSIAPGQPDALDLSENQDSGIDNDNITNHNSLTFSGVGASGERVTIYDNGVALCSFIIADAGGQQSRAAHVDAAAAGGGSAEVIWNITLPTLADGEHRLSISQTDQVMNESPRSDELVLTIDSLAPARPAAPDLAAASDSGARADDNITNVDRPALSGQAEANSLVVVFDNGKLLGQTRADAAGDWHYTPAQALAEGVHALTAQASDVAGNVSATSEQLSLTIDRSAPGAPADQDGAANSIALGAANGSAVGVTLHTADADLAGYRLLDSANGIFAIDAASGQITLANGAALAAQDYTVVAQAVDRAGNASSTQLNIHAYQPNTPPELSGLAAFSFDEDSNGVIRFNVADGQTAAGQLSVSATSSNPALIGAITLDGNGAERTLTLTPLANANGRADITVTVSDGTFSTSKTFVATVNAVNDAPIAANDTLAGSNEDQSVRIAVASLLANDKDVDGNALTLTAVSDANGGTVSFDAATQTITFTPRANYNGAASFNYTVSDGALSSVAKASFTINPVNDAPVAVGETLAAGVEDRVYTVAAATLLANDSDVDGNPLTLTGVSDANGGTVSFNAATQMVTFTPRQDYNGAASFNYTVSDGALSSVAKVSFTLAAVNDAPVAVNDYLYSSYQGDVRTISVASLLGNDYDVDGNALTLTSVSGASGGTVSLDVASQMITFRPSAGFYGQASFNYAISDGSLGASASASFTIHHVDQQGVPRDDAFAMMEDGRLSVTTAKLLENDYDPDSTMAIARVDALVGGPVQLVGGNVVFTPLANFYGHAQYKYTLTDGAFAYVNVNVIQVDDARNDTNDIQKLYVSMFNRPADVNGLEYAKLQFMGLANPSQPAPAHPRTVAEQADEMVKSPEFKGIYQNLNNTQFVDTAFWNMFGRHLGQGETFWITALDNGLSRAQIFTEMFKGAAAVDKAAIINKTMAAEYFTHYLDTPAEIAGFLGANATAVAHRYMESVTSDENSLFLARYNVHATIAEATGAPLGTQGLAAAAEHLVEAQPLVTLTGVAPHEGLLAM